MRKKRGSGPKKPGDNQMIYLNDNEAVLNFINQQSNISDGIRLAILFFLENVGNIDSQKYFPPFYHDNGNITSLIKSLMANGTIQAPETSFLATNTISTSVSSSLKEEKSNLIKEIEQIRSQLDQLSVEKTPMIEVANHEVEVETNNSPLAKETVKLENEVEPAPKEEITPDYQIPSKTIEVKNNDNTDEPELPEFMKNRV